METYPRRNNRKRIIAAVVIIAIIIGGATSYLVLTGHSQAPQRPDFSLIVAIGKTTDPPRQWTPVTDATTLLNGTSIDLVVAANATGGFNDLVQLNFVSPVSGITGTMPRNVIHPCSQCLVAAVALTVKVAPNVITQKASYKFNVTGTSSSIQRTQTFPLRIRSSTLQVTPFPSQVLKPSNFKVSIGISDFYNFQAFQISLDFNSSLVNVVNDTLAPIFYPAGTPVSGSVCTDSGNPSPCNCDSLLIPCDGYVAENLLNNTLKDRPGEGEVTIAATLLGRCLISAPCVDSPGTNVFFFANVTFASNSTAAGIASLKLTNTILTELDGFQVVQFSTPGGFHVLTGNVTVSYRSSRTLISCIPSSVAHGSPTSCTARVTDLSPGTAVTPSGSVNFASNSTASTFSSGGTCILTGSGASATCSVTYTPSSAGGAGTHVLTAVYVGDKVHSGGTSPPFDLAVT